MTKKTSLGASYKQLIDWNTYRLKQNKQSLEKLLVLLTKVDKEYIDDKEYAKDIDDLESLKIIYETGIRNFESQIERYQKLMDSL